VPFCGAAFVFARPKLIVGEAPVASPPPRWIPGVAPVGHSAHRPHERLLPMTFSTPYHRGGDEALDEDRASPQGRQA
jgi:hypothetical protein